MIIDKLSNRSLYYMLGERFQKGLDFLANTDITQLENGKHQIEGDDLFVTVKRYDSFPVAECKLEAHRDYADIQKVVCGTEWFSYCPLDKCTEIEAKPENDVWYYEGPHEPVTLTNDMFAIVLPEDAHMPERAINEVRQPIVKAIVKVRLK